MRILVLIALAGIALACGSSDPQTSEPPPDETTGGSVSAPDSSGGATATCPATAPVHGSPCSTEGQQCGYGGSDTDAADLTDNALNCTCAGGAWSCGGNA